MNIVLGATGQIGSMVVKEISWLGKPVRAVVRTPARFQEKNIEMLQADMFDTKQLIAAFQEGTTVFLLTPEDPSSNSILEDTARIVENFVTAAETTGIQKIVALSCVGAHLNDKTGNILMSRMLEQGIAGIKAEKIIIRPAYYYSNWMGFLDPVKQYGVLPSFFPATFKFDMHSPIDLATFIGKLMTDANGENSKSLYELSGPQKYSATDVAKSFSRILNKEIDIQEILPEQWMETLLSAGFTENTAMHLSDMTKALIEGMISPEYPDKVIHLPSTIETYLQSQLVRS